MNTAYPRNVRLNYPYRQYTATFLYLYLDLDLDLYLNTAYTHWLIYMINFKKNPDEYYFSIFFFSHKGIIVIFNL